MSWMVTCIILLVFAAISKLISKRLFKSWEEQKKTQDDAGSRYGPDKNLLDTGKNLRIFSVFFLAFGLLCLVPSLFTQVPKGHVGVVDVFGDVDTTRIFRQGLHLKLPWENITDLSIQWQENIHPMNISSESGVTIDLEIKVVYQLNPARAAELFQNYDRAYYDVIIGTMINRQVKDLLVQYDAEALYTLERSAVNNMVEEEVIAHAESLGIFVRNVPIYDMYLPVELAESIINKKIAEQQALAMVHILQQEEKEAERMAIEACGIAEYQRIVNSTITSELLQWKGIEALSGFSEGEGTTLVLAVEENGVPVILNTQ